MCGEKADRAFRPGGHRGSPPRMRGKASPIIASWFNFGITPAYAGKSGAVLRVLVLVSDHPRVCGEKFIAILLSFALAGSPPRMRGKVLRPFSGFFGAGITPAYAGKSGINCRVKSSRKDHPRVCGEKREELGGILGPKGSPPRMRGKGKEPIKWLNLRRITPAYAGKRSVGGLDSITLQDHPRVCGEKDVTGMFAAQEQGSPPRMRGKDGVYVLGCSGHGITPAYAGKSL